MRRVEAADGYGAAVHGALDDLVAVDGGADRPAHLDIVEGGLGVVHRQDHLALGRAHDHLETGIGLELGQKLGRREARVGVELARHQRGAGGSRVRDEAEDDRVHRHVVGIAMVGVLLQRQSVAAGPAVEGIRTCPHRIGLVPVDGFGADDGGVAARDVEEKEGVGRRQLDLDRMGIDYGHAFDRLEDVLGRVLAVLGHGPVEGEFHVLGIEVGPVVEFHALGQLECIGEPVVGHCPAFRQVRLYGAGLGRDGE